MNNFKKISLNGAAIFIAALNVFNLERPVPIDSKQYFAYMFSYLATMMGCFALSNVLLLIKNDSKIIKRCSAFTAIILFICVAKCVFKVFDHHAYWDYAAIGIVFIFCFFKLGVSYIIKGLSLTKAIINQIHMRCHYRPKKKPE